MPSAARSISQGAAIWQASLLDLFIFIHGAGAFYLSSTPASPSQIQVDVNGIPTTAYSYYPYGNAIVLSPAELPFQGATVTVTYEVGCP